MTSDLKRKINQLPATPGVYVFKDGQGEILYVGKAVNLKNRVTSYFRQDGVSDRPNLITMVGQIHSLDYTVTSNELESLILERNFIGQLKPKYNIDLRDDKNYIFLKINLHDEIPTINYERKLTDKTARYFGPYTSGLAIKETLRLVRNIFPYCANAKVGAKPCFYYHIGKCPGVCFGKISLDDYRQNYISKIIKFLEGRQSEVLSDLQKQMKLKSDRKLYEQAARVRNQIFALNRVLERQKIIYPKKVNQDIFSVFLDGSACINLFIVRAGKLIQKENFILQNTKHASLGEILDSFLSRYYLDASSRPQDILVPVKIDEQALRSLLGRVKISVPSKGRKFELLKLGEKNAQEYLESLNDKHLMEEAKLMSSLKELQRVLGLPKLPGRIEAFDISNIQGTNPVGSMVVFDFGRPKKSDYRKFKIRSKSTPDDFAMMHEMVTRRFQNKWPHPDLILIDGGKGQLSTAVKVLKQSGVNIPIIGLAKRLEEIFKPGINKPIRLPANSIGLFLLQRIRDEAHRFAITFHRQLRSRKSLTSVLDEISGIGPNKKKQLLSRFGSAKKIQTASLTDLAAIVGKKTAETIKARV